MAADGGLMAAGPVDIGFSSCVCRQSEHRGMPQILAARPKVTNPDDNLGLEPSRIPSAEEAPAYSPPAAWSRPKADPVPLASSCCYRPPTPDAARHSAIGWDLASCRAAIARHGELEFHDKN
jgi:hypothetical protein